MVNNNDYERKPDNRSPDVSEIFESSGNFFRVNFCCAGQHAVKQNEFRSKKSISKIQNQWHFWCWRLLFGKFRKIPNFHLVWNFLEKTRVPRLLEVHRQKKFLNFNLFRLQFPKNMAPLNFRVWNLLRWPLYTIDVRRSLAIKEIQAGLLSVVSSSFSLEFGETFTWSRVNKNFVSKNIFEI